MKARKRLSTILREIIRGRKVMKDIEKGLLSFMLNFKDDITSESLREDQIEDNIIGVLFAAQDTTASAITWTVKYLHDNPKILEIVKVHCNSGLHERIMSHLRVQTYKKNVELCQYIFHFN